MSTTTTTTMNYTHTTYAAAMEQLERNKRSKDTSIVRWDAGMGWTSEGRYCKVAKRIVFQQFNRLGELVV